MAWLMLLRVKFPLSFLFRREQSLQAQRERQDQAQRALVASLRAVGSLFAKLADMVETQRLKSAGFEEQEKFLERNSEKDRA